MDLSKIITIENSEVKQGRKSGIEQPILEALKALTLTHKGKSVKLDLKAVFGIEGGIASGYTSKIKAMAKAQGITVVACSAGDRDPDTNKLLSVKISF
jgi:hypothetical protein